MATALRITLMLCIITAFMLPATPIALADTETIRPNGIGVNTNLAGDEGSENYELVDEVVADDWGTHVFNPVANTTSIDTYAMSNPATTVGVINSVTVYFRATKGPEVVSTATGRAIVYTGGTAYYGNLETLTTSWTVYSFQWALNPATVAAWTWAQISTLETGVELHILEVGETSWCTQVYAVVDYSPVAPTMITNAATSISTTTARMNGAVQNDGGAATTAYIYWGLADQGQTEAWTNRENLGVTPEGNYYFDASGLTATTPYFYIARGNNTAGVGWSITETFTTVSTIGDPSNFTAWPSADRPSINLSWAVGTNSATTRVQFSTAGVLGCAGNGTIVFNGTGSTYEHTDLTPGTIYYYTIHGMSGDDVSTGCAEAQTTVSLASAIEELEISDTPSNWFLSSDYTRMSALPVYGIINDCADSLGMGRQAFWYSLAVYAAILLFIVTYWRGRNLVLSGVVAIVILGLAGPMGLVPGYQVLLFGMFATGLGFAIRRV